ncbi:MAG: glycine cleavage system aminomethyltransferase GcvT [Acidimicrobiales bacterium]
MADADTSQAGPLGETVLHELHRRHGGRFGPFAGWDMPIRYQAGPLAEHEHCRRHASLFDVSHMTVVDLTGPEVGTALETVVPADLGAVAPGRIKYSFFTNDAGGIIDDVMITKRSDTALRLVLNAATTDADLAHLRAQLPPDCVISPRRDLALVALQGPKAAAVLARFDETADDLGFLQEGSVELCGHRVELSRSGYTGGDGFELALPAAHAEALVEALLAEEEVALAGLAARDSLRLEAGMCLYGHDLDETTTPVEAGLGWAIPKARRVPDAGYPGAEVIARQFADGPPRHRVGLRTIGRRPVREGAELSDGDDIVGVVTSGGYSPVLSAPIAMGYVAAAVAVGAELAAVTGNRMEAVRVVDLPFIPKDYHR